MPLQIGDAAVRQHSASNRHPNQAVLSDAHAGLPVRGWQPLMDVHLRRGDEGHGSDAALPAIRLHLNLCWPAAQVSACAIPSHRSTILGFLPDLDLLLRLDHQLWEMHFSSSVCVAKML